MQLSVAICYYTASTSAAVAAAAELGLLGESCLCGAGRCLYLVTHEAIIVEPFL